MAVFQYAGLNADGRNVKGTIEASTEKLAYELLNGKGVIPLTLQAGGQTGAASHAGAKTSIFNKQLFPQRISLGTRALFVRELATFIHADIPLLEALHVLTQQEHNAAFRAILIDVHGRVQGGESFSKALSHHPRVFSALLVSMVKVGETGGVMAPVLEQMAVWMEHEEEIRGEIRGALAYPAMIVVLGLVTVIILLTFVLPRITTIFAGMEGNLPLPTKILMGTSTFVKHWGWLLAIAAAGAFVGLRALLKTPGGKAFWDKFSLRVPIFGSLTQKASIARFARANAALISAGVPLLEALRVVKGLMENGVMTTLVAQTIERVTRGQSLSSTLGESAYFPPAAVHLIRVGERTGRLSEMFERVAQTFEKQTRAQIKIMLDMLSPLMIVALAVMVALIAISILLPIFQMNKLMR